MRAIADKYVVDAETYTQVMMLSTVPLTKNEVRLESHLPRK